MNEVAVMAIRERIGTVERLEYLRRLAEHVRVRDEKLLHELAHR